MAISKEILSALKCCFSNDGHIAIEPILTSCGATGCKECITSLNTEEIECYSCKGKHLVKDLKNMPVIKSMECVVKSFVNELIEFSKVNLEKTTDLRKGKTYEINLKISIRS